MTTVNPAPEYDAYPDGGGYPVIMPSQYQVDVTDEDAAEETQEPDFSNPLQHVGMQTDGTNVIYGQDEAMLLHDASTVPVTGLRSDELPIRRESYPDPALEVRHRPSHAGINLVLPVAATGSAHLAALENVDSTMIQNLGPGVAYFGFRRDTAAPGLGFPIAVGATLVLDPYDGGITISGDGASATSVAILRLLSVRTR